MREREREWRVKEREREWGKGGGQRKGESVGVREREREWGRGCERKGERGERV